MNRNLADRDFEVQILPSALSAATSPPWLRPGLCLRTSPRLSLSWRNCVKEPNLLLSVNSPHRSGREEPPAPPPKSEGGSRPPSLLPDPGAGTPEPPAEAEPPPAPRRTHPALLPASPGHRPPPVSTRSPEGPDSCSQWGRGREPHPAQRGRHRLLSSVSPAAHGGMCVSDPLRGRPTATAPRFPSPTWTRSPGPRPPLPHRGRENSGPSSHCGPQETQP